MKVPVSGSTPGPQMVLWPRWSSFTSLLPMFRRFHSTHWILRYLFFRHVTIEMLIRARKLVDHSDFESFLWDTLRESWLGNPRTKWVRQKSSKKWWTFMDFRPCLISRGYKEVSLISDIQAPGFRLTCFDVGRGIKLLPNHLTNKV